MTTIRKALVSGHSRGLGAELAAQLVQQGYLTLGISRRPGAVPGVELDLGNLESLASWLATGELARFVADADELVLINNAGTVAPIGRVGEQNFDQLVAAINLNVTATIALTNAVVAAKPKGGVLKVVHISSGAGRHPYPGWSTYGATKAALDMHARCLAVEKHPDVRVESIAPGVVDTGMQAEIRQADGFELRDNFVSMFEAGALTSAADAAASLIARIASPDFGREVVSDVRN